MSSTTITITKFNGTTYTPRTPEMAQLLEKNQVYGIMKGSDDKREEPAAIATATEKAASRDWMNRHGVARSTIVLGIEPWIHADYTVIENAKMHCEKRPSAYKSKLKLNVFKISKHL
jgi:hypothetical protein